MSHRSLLRSCADLAVLACAIVWAAGCRDVVFGGERIGDQHVLAGRPFAEGGPGIGSADQERGFFVSTEEALQPLEAELRARIGGSLSLIDRPRFDPRTAGTVTMFDRIQNASPTDPGFFPMATELGLGDQFLIEGTLNADTLVSEYEQMCLNPFFAPLFPAINGSCDPLDLEDAEDALERITFTVRSEDIEVRWLAPENRLNREFFSIGEQPRGLRGRCGSCEGNFVCPTGGRAGIDQCVPGECDARSFSSQCLPGYICPIGGRPGDPCVWGVPCATGADCREVAESWVPSGTCTRNRCSRFVRALFDSDRDLVAPVLAIEVPFDLDADLTDWIAIFFATFDPEEVRATYRIQPVACTAGRCRTPERNYWGGYRMAGGGGDLAFSQSGVDIHLGAATSTTRIAVIPGIGLGLGCVLALPSCILAVEAIRDEMRHGMQRGVDGTRELLDNMVRGRTLAVQRTTGAQLQFLCAIRDGDAGACRILGRRPQDLAPAGFAAMATVATVDPGNVTVRLDRQAGETAPLYAQLGASAFGAPAPSPVPLGNGLSLATARGATITSVVVDLSPLAVNCTTRYAANCTNPDPALNAAWCPACDECTRVTAAIGSVPPICNFSVPYIFTADDPTVSGDDTGSVLGAPAIPAVPALTALLEGSPNLAHELRRVATAPLEELERRTGADARYTSIVFCPRPSPDPAPVPPVCPEGANGAVFSFGQDPDADGVFDGADGRDNCPDVPNPDQANSDGDRWGDACDHCPCVFSTEERDLADRDGDGLEDVCDCDVEADGCNNEGAECDGSAVRTCETNGEVFDERPRECESERVCSGDPRTCAIVCVNTDGDANIDDCDADDDDDGILDDGAGDSRRLYTPCTTGVTAMCDDNCEDVPNSTQADGNADGRGDVCDDLCGSPSPPAFCGGGAAGGGGGFFGDPAFGPGALPGPDCVRDRDAGCFFSLIDCTEFGAFDQCGPFADALVLVGQDGAEIQSVTAPQIPGFAGFSGAVIAIPDQDGDGIDELVAGSTESRDCRSGVRCLDRAGEVIAIGSRDGALLWRLSSGQEGAEMGAALAFVQGAVLAGAPGARGPGGVASGAVLRISLIDGAPRFDGALLGEAEGDRFGESLALVGDIDGDGDADGVLVGAPGADGSAGAGAGRIVAFDHTGRRFATFEGPAAGVRMGTSASVLMPNAFGQGSGVLAGMPAAFGGAGALAFFDWSGALVWSLGGAPGEELGISLAWAADFDGDRRAEIAVGAPGADSGAGHVYLARESGVLLPFLAGGAGDRFGRIVAAPGDIDRDRRADLVVEIPGRSIASGHAGTWVLLPGAGGKNPNQPPGEPSAP